MRGEGETSTNTLCPQDCQEWCSSQTFLTGQSLKGQSPPPIMVCLLERATSVRPHAHTHGRVCACSVSGAVNRPTGQRWILESGLRVGSPGKPPC